MAKVSRGEKLRPIVNQTPLVGRNAPCPCGSGKKFKACHGKPEYKPSGYDYGYRKRRQPQCKEFGEFVRATISEDLQGDLALATALRDSGVPEADIQGFLKTGILVTEQNRDLLPQSVVQAWDEALAAYLHDQESKHATDSTPAAEPTRDASPPVHGAVAAADPDPAGDPGPADADPPRATDPGGGV